MNEPLARTMGAQILKRIREKILSAEYAPGSALLQDAIAAEFGVSKIPVREALVQLSSEGLVNIFAHKGFQVRPVSADEMEEIFRLRLAIEPMAVAEGARIAEPADHDACAQAMEAENLRIGAGELNESGDLNFQFHLALIVPRLQPVTREVIHRLHSLAQRYVRLHLVPPGRAKRSVKIHAAMYDAWRRRKADVAADLTRKHLEQIRDELRTPLRAP